MEWVGPRSARFCQKKICFVVVTNVDDTNIYSGSFPDGGGIRPIRYRNIYDLYFIFSLEFCFLSVLFQCIFWWRLSASLTIHCHVPWAPDLETMLGHVLNDSWNVVHQSLVEFMRIQRWKAILISYHRFYNHRINARPTVQINSMKMTLRLVKIG